jgi:transposase
VKRSSVRMRFVAIESVEQQEIQAIHRMRGLVVERRTAQVSPIRGLLLEYGIEMPHGRAAVGRCLAEILEDADNGLSERFRAELRELAEELRHLDARVDHYDEPIEAIARGDRRVQCLMTTPGLGAKGATALVAAVGKEPHLFKNRRGLAAWLGLVPRQLLIQHVFKF